MRTGRLPLGNFDEKTSISSREKLREERPHEKIFPSRRRPLFSAARESRDALKPSAAISGLRNFPVAKTLGTSRSRAFASDKKRDRGRASGEKKGDRREDRGARKTESPAPSVGQSPPSRFPFFASLPALESPRSDVGRVENLGRLRRLLRVQKRVSELRYLLVLDGELA